MKLTADGNTLTKDGDFLVLTHPYSNDKAYLVEHEGATAEEGMFVKRFPISRFHAEKKTIAHAIELFHNSVDFVSGMSGYSSLNAKRCAAFNIRPGEYEAAVMGIMQSAVNRVRNLMPGVRYGIVYGSSSMGVDLAMQEVADKENIPILGFICLDYLWYVDADVDGPPICITATKEQYCHAYVENADLLMACNGGAVSYKMDTIAAMERFIPVLPVNVLGMLGSSVPAFNDEGEVNDAVGALLHALRMISFDSNVQGLAEDRFAIVADRFANAVTARAREVAPPKYAYAALAA